MRGLVAFAAILVTAGSRPWRKRLAGGCGPGAGPHDTSDYSGPPDLGGAGCAGVDGAGAGPPAADRHRRGAAVLCNQRRPCGAEPGPGGIRTRLAAGAVAGLVAASGCASRTQPPVSHSVRPSPAGAANPAPAGAPTLPSAGASSPARAGAVPLPSAGASSPATPGPAGTGETSVGCLGQPSPRPAGGWFPYSGGEPPQSGSPTETTESSTPALTRLSVEARSALPPGYELTNATELRSGQCVTARVMGFSAPGGGFVGFYWEQLVAPRSRSAAVQVGGLMWSDRADGGTLGTDTRHPDYQSVTVVRGDGQLLRATARGRRAHSTAGWPTTRALWPNEEFDPAPLAGDQVRSLAERLVSADQR